MAEATWVAILVAFVPVFFRALENVLDKSDRWGKKTHNWILGGSTAVLSVTAFFLVLAAFKRDRGIREVEVRAAVVDMPADELRKAMGANEHGDAVAAERVFEHVRETLLAWINGNGGMGFIDLIEMDWPRYAYLLPDAEQEALKRVVRSHGETLADVAGDLTSLCRIVEGMLSFQKQPAAIASIERLAELTDELARCGERLEGLPPDAPLDPLRDETLALLKSSTERARGIEFQLDD